MRCVLETASIITASSSSLNQLDDVLRNPNPEMGFISLSDVCWYLFQFKANVLSKLKEILESNFVSDRQRKILLRLERSEDWYALSTLLVALEVHNNAFQSYDFSTPEYDALIIAGNNLRSLQFHSAQEQFNVDRRRLSPSAFLSYQDTFYAGMVTDFLNYRFESFSLGATSASGLFAVNHAAQLITAGLKKRILIISPPYAWSPLDVHTLQTAGAMQRPTNAQDQGLVSEKYIPFDVNLRGFCPGESASCILLTADYMNNRDSSVVYINRGSFVSSAHSGSSPDVASEIATMRAAITNAGINALDIDYICSHGTGSDLGDRTELEAIANVISSNYSLACRVNSNKGLFGHSINGAGSLSVIATWRQILGGFVHGNVGLSNTRIPYTWLVGEKTEQHTIKNALVNSFGFFGTHGSIVMSNGFTQ